jgi:exodeoxyribonuclease VII large subunit
VKKADEEKFEKIEKQLKISKSQIITVSQVSDYLSKKLDQDDFLSMIYIIGEVSNLSKYNHIYFDLKDDNSLIKATMFEDQVKGLDFELENGMEVLVLGKVQLYAKVGKYQVKVSY